MKRGKWLSCRIIIRIIISVLVRNSNSKTVILKNKVEEKMPSLKTDGLTRKIQMGRWVDKAVGSWEARELGS
jgi:hypothetical protein